MGPTAACEVFLCCTTTISSTSNPRWTTCRYSTRARFTTAEPRCRETARVARRGSSHPLRVLGHPDGRDVDALRAQLSSMTAVVVVLALVLIGGFAGSAYFRWREEKNARSPVTDNEMSSF